MKTRQSILASVVGLLWLTAPSMGVEAEGTDVDWPEFLRQHDVTLSTLPADWREAPHFGNAMVGSMLHRAGDTIRLQVFRADVQDHRDDTWGWTADKGLESLYWQTIYRFGCTSRTGRSMVDTSGLWFQGGPWAYITTDWNIQSAHWPVCAANRLDQGLELVNRLHDGRDALIRAVRPMEWQQDSAYLALAVAPDMRGSRDGDMRYDDLVGNLPWTLHNAWMQYRNMLIQSWSDPAKDESGPIRISPALPSAWQDVEFRDLRAEGAFLVSAKRSAGQTQWVQIKSLAGEPCRVRTNWAGDIRVQGGRPFSLRKLSPGLYQIDLQRGEEVLLRPGSRANRART